VVVIVVVVVVVVMFPTFGHGSCLGRIYGGRLCLGNKNPPHLPHFKIIAIFIWAYCLID